MNSQKYYKKLGKVLITKQAIQKKIKELALIINKDYHNTDVVFISNLKGSFRFLSDLMAHLHIPTMIDFISFTGYKGTQPDKIKIIKDLKINVRHKNVIIIEDIIDTGMTVDFIIKYLHDFKFPKKIKICTLLDKPSRRIVDVPIHYKGFELPDKFVVGYGLDYKEYFRELNEIRVFHE